MSSDIEKLFDELARIMGKLAEFGGRQNDDPRGERPMTARVSFQIGFLDEIARTRHAVEKKEPLIDVIETKDSYRIVVLLPGVRKEEVRVSGVRESLKVEVVKGDAVFVKEIPCEASPTRIAIVSAKERNSVVELVFAKKGRGEK